MDGWFVLITIMGNQKKSEEKRTHLTLYRKIHINKLDLFWLTQSVLLSAVVGTGKVYREDGEHMTCASIRECLRANLCSIDLFHWKCDPICQKLTECTRKIYSSICSINRSKQSILEYTTDCNRQLLLTLILTFPLGCTTAIW